MASDRSLFFKHARWWVSGLLALHVGDSIACGDNYFNEASKKTVEGFEFKGRKTDNRRFPGVYLDDKQAGYDINQHSYIERLEVLSKYVDFSQLRRSSQALMSGALETRYMCHCQKTGPGPEGRIDEVAYENIQQWSLLPDFHKGPGTLLAKAGSWHYGYSSLCWYILCDEQE